MQISIPEIKKGVLFVDFRLKAKTGNCPDRLRNRAGIHTNEFGNLRQPIAGRLVGHAQ